MPILTAEERVGGTVGGRYRIESILGEGGTSTVYRALHTFTNRRVAVKLLKPQHARDPDVVSRFLKEARVASTVVHPHVVAVLDMGTDEDCTYLVMELLAGESLAARLGRVGVMESSEAVALLRPLLDAVCVAHDKGIVHRDIKPENVLVGDRGDGVERAVLLDFGMAKTTEAAWGHMTQSGVLVGTPYYMSPEQAEGALDLGPATDVWSMGVLLYRALSGDLPFTGTSPTSLLLAIARGDHVALEERAPHVPRAIAAWVEGALLADRQKRYADMRAMLSALDAALAGTVRPRTIVRSGSNSGIRSIPLQEGGGEEVAPARQRRWRPILAVAVVGLLMILGAAAFYGSRAEAPTASSVVPATSHAEARVEVPSVPELAHEDAHPAPTVAEAAEEPEASPAEATPVEATPVEATPVEATPVETVRARPESERGRTRERPRAVEATPEATPPEGPPTTGLVTEW